MALDSSDYKRLGEVRDNTEKTVQEVRRLFEQRVKTDAAFLAVFNRISASLESIDAEIKALRRDLNPQFDKARISLKSPQG